MTKQTDPLAEKYMTTSDVAELLGLSKQRVIELAAGHRITHFKVGRGGRIRYPESGVRQFIQENTHGPALSR